MKNRYLLSFVIICSMSLLVHALTTELRLDTIVKYVVNTSDTSVGVSSPLDQTAASCLEPSGLKVDNVGIAQATVSWVDTVGTNWEYYVQQLGMGLPTLNGTATTTTQATFTTSTNGLALVADTDYEVFVRSICSDGTSTNWEGPLLFRTKCSAYTAYPFEETFNTNSPLYHCWTLLPESGTKAWQRYNYTQYEGDRTMYFSPATKEEAWLISPTFKLTQGDIYELSYYYRSGSTSSTATLEVALSTNGIELTDFTDVLVASSEIKNTTYTKRTVYLSGYNGDVNIAWHATSTNYYSLYVDFIKLEKVDCINPIDEDIKILNLLKNSLTVTWEDDANQRWEYYLQLAGGGEPTMNGLSTTNKSINLLMTSGTQGAALQPNTEYEFYLRSNCTNGKGKWVGPIKFRTPCSEFLPPFWEGFNLDSPTINCWSSIDNGKNGARWQSTSTKFEGDRSFYYTGDRSDNWLISPTFTLDAKKHYVLRYHYRTVSSYRNDFAVKLSTTGSGVSDFKTTLLEKKGHGNDLWEEEVLVLTGIGGNINLGWQVKTKNSYSYLYIDNLFLEEVDCPQPVKLSTTSLTKDSATITWEDQVGSKWEYIVQPSADSDPLPDSTGITTTTKSNVITKDKTGTNLLPNTEYEFYVRTECGAGKKSVWSGPYTFRTACEIQSLPFWEGFNGTDLTYYCWTILDLNEDGSSSTGRWKLYNYNMYEGAQGMYFYRYDPNNEIESDDWLISPTFTFTPGKIYRLKYHFKAPASYNFNSLEVLASNSGTNTASFTKVVVPNTTYKNDHFIEKIVFVTGLSGNVNFAWHSKGLGSRQLYIDNVFVEEVINCPEPLDLNVTDIEKDSAKLEWTDDFGATNWEYYVGLATATAPSATTTGTSATTKSASITKDSSGANLLPNTDYDFYVRTKCADGTYSIWAGPFRFITGCDVYQVPFWEGFNSDTKTVRCWTILNTDNDWAAWNHSNYSSYEGDGVMYFSGTTGVQTDWLISPTLVVTPGKYVLKYYYKANTYYENQFEVKLSSSGIDQTDFTTTLVPSRLYQNSNYQEEVVFVDITTAGQVNLAWIATTAEKHSNIYIDNIWFKKVTTCPEPYYVKISNSTTTGFDVEWQQQGGVTEWEVVVVNYGEDVTATPLQTIPVNGTPKITITGLASGKSYSVFVRAKCTATTTSDWSTSGNGGTKVGANDDCGSAITIPVNPELECIQNVSGSLFGSTETPNLAAPNCASSLKYDVWFEFTATSILHLLTVSDLFSLTDRYTSVSFALYDQPCATMTGTALTCKTFYGSDGDWILANLVKGKKYYIRVGTNDDVRDFFFTLCLTSTKNTPMEIHESDTKYTVEELVQEVLINSNCDLVSNIHYQVGDGSAATQNINAIGYFNKANSIFPFQEGIVLGTSQVKYVAGPYYGDGGNRGSNRNRWDGDQDIKDAVKDAGGGPTPDMRVTQLEFDFIPVKDSIQFDYLFASNSYVFGCTYDCGVGALFAAWLVDTETGEGQNLAKINNTNIPISLNTIRDAEKSGIRCESRNKEYYWNHYDKNQSNSSNPIDAPFDFVGSTVAMSSDKVFVLPGRKYHIKMAVMDFCTNDAHTSAVFFAAGSFDLGSLDLGADLLVETGNALCDGDPKVIKSGLSGDNDQVKIQWYKDEVKIPGATEPNYTVTESGSYKVVGTYDEINCEIVGEVKVEIFPMIHTVIDNHADVNICRFAQEGSFIDLTSDEGRMFGDTDRQNYQLTYYVDKELTTEIEDPANYVLSAINETHSVYIYIEDIRSGCSEVFTFKLASTEGNMPIKPADIIVCDQYVLPNLETDQFYFTEPGGKGVEYKGGDVLTAGEYVMYVYQDNGNGCFEEVSFEIKVTQKQIARVFEDQILSCSIYELEELNEYSKYFIEVSGVRVAIPAGTLIYNTNTRVYVVAESKDGICKDESSFVIRYEECPIPKGISPNGDGINDAFDLSDHGVSRIQIFNRNGTEVYSLTGLYTNQWKGQGSNNKNLPSGTYFYVIQSFDKTRTGWVELIR